MLDLDTRILEGMTPNAQESILELVRQIVISLPEKNGLRLLDEMKLIADLCYQCEIGARTGKDN